MARLIEEFWYSNEGFWRFSSQRRLPGACASSVGADVAGSCPSVASTRTDDVARSAARCDGGDHGSMRCVQVDCREAGRECRAKAIGGGSNVLNQSSIPVLRALAEALSLALPEDDSRGDPKYLSRSALAVSLAQNWSEEELTVALDCARRYWSGEASDQEREEMRARVVERTEGLRKRGLQDSTTCVFRRS
jgi:hypothetical protein